MPRERLLAPHSARCVLCVAAEPDPVVGVVVRRSVVFAVTGETLPEIEARAQSELDRFCGGLLPHVGRVDWDAEIREVHRANKVSMYRAEVRAFVERGSGACPPATPDPAQHEVRP